MSFISRRLLFRGGCLFGELLHLASEQFLVGDTRGTFDRLEVLDVDGRPVEPLPHETLADIDGAGQGGLAAGLLYSSGDRGVVHGRDTSLAIYTITSPASGRSEACLIALLV
jgi:hypothetical protein